MNTIKSFLKIFSLVSLLLVLPSQAKAQFDLSNLNLIIDWQMSAPMSTDFADKISGHGANFEVTYSITPNWEAGLFLNYHTNHKYIGRSTFPVSSTGAMTSDQLRSAFQLPFGAAFNFVMLEEGVVRPYIGAKIGTLFARYTTYYGISGCQDDDFGFFISPEFGFRILPMAHKGAKWGFHIAGFYNYSTAHLATLTHDLLGQSNVGFRVGMCF